MDKKVIEERIAKLKQEVARHQQELNFAQQAIQQSSNFIISKQGGVVELEKLLNPEKYADPETKKLPEAGNKKSSGKKRKGNIKRERHEDVSVSPEAETNKAKNGNNTNTK